MNIYLIIADACKALGCELDDPAVIAREALRAERKKELRQAVNHETSKSCLWIESSDGEMWETECGNAFVLNDGTPQNNCMLYCCYCGKSLGQQLARGDEA